MKQESCLPLVLCILDGWGHRAERADNAIALAETPVFDRLWEEAPHALLKTSAEEVGLPPGQMGNSEVGHTNLGAGRIVQQDLPRIDAAIADGTLAANAALAEFTAALKESGGTCHLMGLVSPGGVHSHQRQIAALAGILAATGITVAIHAFLDGRDTPPQSASGYLADFEQALASARGAHGASLATVCGRYYAMDRDRRWDRSARAYAAIANGEGIAAANGAAAIRAAYDGGLGDEFVEPTVIGAYRGIREGDGVLMANFRADRVRQILAALADPNFEGFAVRNLSLAARCGMIAYSADLDRHYEALFAPLHLKDTLGEVVAAAGLRQLRIAETEKYAHVTFFFNGGEERVFPGETRILVPSPAVATYDEAPEMSASEVTDRLVAALDSGDFDVAIVNYANTDMVGHTGQLGAAIKAVEAVDGCLGRLQQAVRSAGGVLVVTADHGNAEKMQDKATGQPHTAHTTGAVPLIVIGGRRLSLTDGRLADVAPTLLHLLGLKQPAAMTGRCLANESTTVGAERAAHG